MNVPVPTDSEPSNNNNRDSAAADNNENGEDDATDQLEELTLDGEDNADATNDKREWLNYDDIPTFNTIFWAVWKSLNYTLPSEEDQDKCFMFEFLSRDGRVGIRNTCDSQY